jgi:hypothetical protein
VDNLTEVGEVSAASTHAGVNPAQAGAALWMKITLAQGVLNTAAQRFWSHPAMPRMFPQFLIELYSLVSCSVPLMSAAFERASELSAVDPLAAITAAYLEQHILEESHHDEWLLNDLTEAGMDRAALLQRAPSANVARLVGAQYCWIRHAHPAALFGYLAVIEGNPPLPQHLNEIQQLTGYPPEVFRCLHLHAADDIEHLNELRSTIARLPLHDAEAALISTSAFATMQGLASIFEELEEQQQTV